MGPRGLRRLECGQASRPRCCEIRCEILLNRSCRFPNDGHGVGGGANPIARVDRPCPS